jgi:hypothetical protein
MGGQICIAIRKGEDEHIFDAWTNQWNGFLCEPTFRTGGKWYQEWLRRASPDNEWPRCRTIKTIQSIEYGLVLIDLNYQHVWSCNYYTEPGALSFARLDPENVKLAKQLCRLGQISHVLSMSERPQKVYPGTEKSIRSLMARDHWGYAYIAPTVLYVEHEGEKPTPSQMRWAEQWARQRGWTSPFRQQRKKKA